MADSDGKKGSWAPTRGYFQVTPGAGGGAPKAAAPAKKKAAAEEPAAAEAEEETVEEPVASGGGEGSKGWAPTRGYFMVAAGSQGGVKKTAVKKAAPKKSAAAAPTAAEAGAGEVPSAAAKPAAKAAAPKPAAKAAAAAVPAMDPLRDSVTTVPSLIEGPVARSIEAQIYDAPDSETTLYKVSALNVAFALSSLLLLIYTVMVVWQDYDRGWKDIQARWNENVAQGFSDDLEAARKKQAEDFTVHEPTVLDIVGRVGGEEAKTSVSSRAAVAGAPGSVARMDTLLAGAYSILDKDPRFNELAQRRAAAKKAETAYTLEDEKFRALKGDFQAAKFQHEEVLRHIQDHEGDTPEGKHLTDDAKRKFNDNWVLRVERAEANVKSLEQAAKDAKAALDELLAKETRVGEGEKAASLPDVEAELGKVSRAVTESKKNLDLVETNWRNFVRNMPFLDFLAPSYKIEKVVLPELKEDLNFEKYARIDRCKTCHVNIDNPDIKVDRSNPKIDDPEWGTVFQSHPRLDLFVGSASPHPYQQFGCTICHWGDGHATDFITAAHTPSSEEQKERWEHEYNWEPLHHQDFPMYRKEHVYASCLKCHSQEHKLRGGSTFNLGYEIIKSYGCFGCHNLEAFKGADKVGPSLVHVADKASPEFLYKWVRNPTHFRPTTRMPRFFDLTNTTGTMLVEDNRGEQATVTERDFNVRNGVEAFAIASYLSATSQRRGPLPAPAGAGDAARGRELFLTSGCLGCHSVKAEGMAPELKGKDPAVETKAAIVALDAAMAALPPAPSDRTALRVAAAGAAREALARLQTWFDRLAVGINVETLYADAMGALESLGKLEESLAADGGAIAQARAAAGVIYDRWVHNTFAPDLSAVGSKLRPEWLADWITDPSKHDPDTTMPRLRIETGDGGAQKVADMVAYLMTLRDSTFEGREVFAMGSPEARAVLDEIYFDYIHRQTPRAETEQLVRTKSVEEKLQLVGHRLIRRYGCFGCHDGIVDVESKAEDKTFDRAQQIGTDLEGWGIKLSAFLDYGHWGHQHSGREGIGHNRYDWAFAKLTDTRRFDVIPAEKEVAPDKYVYEPTHRLIQKSPEELLKMPQFAFTVDPEQVNAVVTMLASLVKDDVAVQRKRILSGDQKTLEEGSRLIAKLNCMGCHRIGAESQEVLTAKLPSFSLSGDSAEDTRRGELEKETWLARGVALFGNPVPSDTKADGLWLEKGTLLNRQVFDPTTMRPDTHQPVSVVELARGPEDKENKVVGHFVAQAVAPGSRYLHVAGYEEGRIRFYFGNGVDQRPQAPPPLVREGERVRSEWLFKFLLDVQPIRPWLKVRMPSFHLSDKDSRLIVAWFKLNALVPEPGSKDPRATIPVPVANELFVADTHRREQAAQGKFLFGNGSPPERPGLQCNGCHPTGSVLPTYPLVHPADRIDIKRVVAAHPELVGTIADDSYSVVCEDGTVVAGFKEAAAAQAHIDQSMKGKKCVVAEPWSKASWGPDLGKAAARLRPDWIALWLDAPPNFMPGTKMPSFFGEQTAAFQDKQGTWQYNHVNFRFVDAEERKQALIQYLVHMQQTDGVARAGD